MLEDIFEQSMAYFCERGYYVANRTMDGSYAFLVMEPRSYKMKQYKVNFIRPGLYILEDYKQGTAIAQANDPGGIVHAITAVRPKGVYK